MAVEKAQRTAGIIGLVVCLVAILVSLNYSRLLFMYADPVSIPMHGQVSLFL